MDWATLWATFSQTHLVTLLTSDRAAQNKTQIFAFSIIYLLLNQVYIRFFASFSFHFSSGSGFAKVFRDSSLASFT
jgi:hypothetical protein